LNYKNFCPFHVALLVDVIPTEDDEVTGGAHEGAGDEKLKENNVPISNGREP
jgi:hypothetical protein